MISSKSNQQKKSNSGSENDKKIKEKTQTDSSPPADLKKAKGPKKRKKLLGSGMKATRNKKKLGQENEKCPTPEDRPELKPQSLDQQDKTVTNATPVDELASGDKGKTSEETNCIPEESPTSKSSSKKPSPISFQDKTRGRKLQGCKFESTFQFLRSGDAQKVLQETPTPSERLLAYCEDCEKVSCGSLFRGSAGDYHPCSIGNGAASAALEPWFNCTRKAVLGSEGVVPEASQSFKSAINYPKLRTKLRPGSKPIPFSQPSSKLNLANSNSASCKNPCLKRTQSARFDEANSVKSVSNTVTSVSLRRKPQSADVLLSNKVKPSANEKLPNSADEDSQGYHLPSKSSISNASSSKICSEKAKDIVSSNIASSKTKKIDLCRGSAKQADSDTQKGPDNKGMKPSIHPLPQKSININPSAKSLGTLPVSLKSNETKEKALPVSSNSLETNTNALLVSSTSLVTNALSDSSKSLEKNTNALPVSSNSKNQTNSSLTQRQTGVQLQNSFRSSELAPSKLVTNQLITRALLNSTVTCQTFPRMFSCFQDELSRVSTVMAPLGLPSFKPAHRKEADSRNKTETESESQTKPVQPKISNTWEVTYEQVPGDDRLQFRLRKRSVTVDTADKEQSSSPTPGLWKGPGEALSCSPPRLTASSTPTDSTNVSVHNDATSNSKKRHKKVSYRRKPVEKANEKFTKKLSDVFQELREQKGCLVNNCKMCGGRGKVDVLSRKSKALDILNSAKARLSGIVDTVQTPPSSVKGQLPKVRLQEKNDLSLGDHSEENVPEESPPKPLATLRCLIRSPNRQLECTDFKDQNLAPMLPTQQHGDCRQDYLLPEASQTFHMALRSEEPVHKSRIPSTLVKMKGEVLQITPPKIHTYILPQENWFKKPKNSEADHKQRTANETDLSKQESHIVQGPNLQNVRSLGRDVAKVPLKTQEFILNPKDTLRNTAAPVIPDATLDTGFYRKRHNCCRPTSGDSQYGKESHKFTPIRNFKHHAIMRTQRNNNQASFVRQAGSEQFNSSSYAMLNNRQLKNIIENMNQRSLSESNPLPSQTYGRGQGKDWQILMPLERMNPKFWTGNPMHNVSQNSSSSGNSKSCMALYRHGCRDIRLLWNAIGKKWTL